MTQKEAGKLAWKGMTEEEKSLRASKNATSRWSKVSKEDRRVHAVKMLKSRWENYRKTHEV